MTVKLVSILLFVHLYVMLQVQTTDTLGLPVAQLLRTLRDSLLDSVRKIVAMNAPYFKEKGLLRYKPIRDDTVCLSDRFYYGSGY